MYEQLLPRRDEQIATMEMLAIALLGGSFDGLVRGELLLLFIDSDGVRHALLRGTGGPPEVTMLVGGFWLAMAQLSAATYAARVESKANIADAPTRDDIPVLQSLGAVECPSFWPEWAKSFWVMP